MQERRHEGEATGPDGAIGSDVIESKIEGETVGGTCNFGDERRESGFRRQ